jgi:ADP-ribose pyrophosphatase
VNRLGFQHLGDQLRHQGFAWRVVTGTFRDPAGRDFTRDVVRSPGAVGVLPLWRHASGQVRVLLLRQYRPVLNASVIEIPAGMRDVIGEEPAVTAQRELAEEAGRHAAHLEQVLEMLPSPGMSDGTTVIFLATDLTEVPTEAHGPEEEHLELLEFSLDEAVAAIEHGDITDAKTVVALLLAQRRLDAGTLEIPSTR